MAYIHVIVIIVLIAFAIVVIIIAIVIIFVIIIIKMVRWLQPVAVAHTSGQSCDFAGTLFQLLPCHGNFVRETWNQKLKGGYPLSTR